MSDDRLDVELKADGFKVSTEGGSVGRMSNALIDAISPFTSGLGTIGDVIRTYRQENAIRALARAKKLAEEHGVEIQPVAPKFLVNWIEDASLEDEHESGVDLTKMWASLLVSASEETKPGHHLYRRILSEFTPDHANLICYMLCIDRIDAEISSEIRKTHDRLIEFRDSSPIALSESQLTDQYIAEMLLKLEGPGYRFLEVKFSAASGAIPIEDKTIYHGSWSELDRYNSEHVVAILKHFGLIEPIRFSVQVKNKTFFSKFETKYPDSACGLIELNGFTLTPLGRDFVQTCCIGMNDD